MQLETLVAQEYYNAAAALNDNICHQDPEEIAAVEEVTARITSTQLLGSDVLDAERLIHANVDIMRVQILAICKNNFSYEKRETGAGAREMQRLQQR